MPKGTRIRHRWSMEAVSYTHLDVYKRQGQGPAWDNSLFEDNAEFGYGMLLAQNAIRDGLKAKVESVMASEAASDEVKAACKEYLDTFGIGALNGTATDKLVAALDGCDCPTCKDIVTVSYTHLTYKGHAPVILRNTSGVVLPPDETTPVESSTVPTVDGMPDGYVPEETVPGPAGNGGENQGPGVPTTPAPTTPAPTAPSGTTAAPAPGPDGGQSQTQSQGPGPGQPEANTQGGPTITPIAPNPGN